MKYMKEVESNVLDLYIAARNCLFLQELGTGSISEEKLKNYMIQDSIYLRYYLKCFAMAIFKAKSLREMQFFNTLLSFVDEDENATRQSYLRSFGLTDDDIETFEMADATRNYVSFLLETAKREDNDGILFAVLPCMLGYEDAFIALKEKYPSVLEGPYADLVTDYTSGRYEKSCQVWREYADSRLSSLEEKRRNELSEIYREGCRQELMFWKMAGGEK